MKKLIGKTAIITGGASGIGKKAAELFLKEGANVAIVDVREDELTEVAEALEQFGPIISIRADVSSEEDVKKYVEKTVSAFGKIDVFFNNAGIEGKVAPITEQTVEDFDKVQEVNVRGVFLGLKHVMPVMIKQQSGSIINTSSVAGFIGSPGVAPYIASKHAVIGLTKTAALEAASANVRVNSIHPSPVNTRMMRSLEENINPGYGEKVKETLSKAIPLGRYGETGDVANLVLFLASDESVFITGSQFRIDGGMSAQ